MSDIFQEVDEDLRRDRAITLWRRYGKYVIGVAVAIVLATAAQVGWKKYRDTQRERDGDAFAAATELVRVGKTDEAVASYEALAASAKSGYGTLARLRAASGLAAAGKRDEAVALYDRLAKDGGVDAHFAQAAAMHAVLLLVDTANVDELRVRLQPLIGGGPMRHLAREIDAALKLREKDIEGARRGLTTLVDDAEAPAGVRGRAAELLAAIGGAKP
ncbi:MAG: tetratricopeptide repeat protein [Alphaproteobacteria bacterium]|nr:tetratricopeptide repeat protein [Alphaproteobacteria bacterium]